jgi:hypothetical protein
LQVSGDVTPGTSAAFNLGSSSLRWNNIYLSNAPDVSSDIRLKKDVQPSDLGLAFVNSLRPVSWIWKNTAQGSERHYGVIAQEAERAIVKAKKDSASQVIVAHDKATDSYSVRYTELIAPLIKAVQEIYKELVGVKSVADAQSGQIIEIESLVKKLQLENTHLKHKAQVSENENIELKARLDRLEKMFELSQKANENSRD